ncbi:MAG: bifunctional 2-polyprenyl-6-hydroxyphenol methylase/3-demethylubiquinol 3-O-methyltransferase UbiG, partial [Mariprofundales bacterium]|nr:bifunctional 2-polyprenyl-6-hydroxyphenol methylase/3-demethylubiquinol 3-O-methyltransferase UbiG [Mariprofundales bacterium]
MTTMQPVTNYFDADEIDKFEAMAAEWWSPTGRFRPLHRINPLRLAYIERGRPLRDLRVVDVGCGGGLLSESMACRGAVVTGIDRSRRSLAVATTHAAQSGVQVDYQLSDAESWAADHSASYDLVTCLEVLEHVPDVPRTVAACSALLKPGGRLYFATLNRTAISWVKAILGAEYLLGWLPKGTHDYQRFIRPSELYAAVRAAGMEVRGMRGLCFDLLGHRFYEGDDLSVN